MTVDTAALRAQWEAIREQQGPDAFGMIAHVGDGIALLDALEAEREKVRVLVQALEYASEYVWDDDALGRGLIHAALATAGGEGATP